MGKPAPRGQPQIEVEFSIDSNGILVVQAKDLDSGNSANLEVKPDNGRLSAEEIERMIKVAEDEKERDDLIREFKEIYNQIDAYVHTIAHEFETSKTDLPAESIEAINNMIDEGKHWLDVNSNIDQQEIIQLKNGIEERKQFLEDLKNIMPQTNTKDEL